MALPGIFCIENWSDRLDAKDTVRPILDLLEDQKVARVIHQRVDTPRELGHYLSRLSRMSSYQVAYLAMHGVPGGVMVGSERIRLETLTAWSSMERAPALDGHGRPTEWTLDLGGKVVYFGSCSSLRVSEQRLSNFKAETGCRAVCGYTRSVDWIDSAGFELVFLSALADAMSAADPQRQLRRNIRRLRTNCGGLLDRLGFACWPAWD